MSDAAATTTTSESAAAGAGADDSTVPTDLTVSVSSEGGRPARGSPISGAHRARLMHDLQLLRVELAELTHQRQVEHREQQSRVDELEDQLADALHQRNMLQIRLSGQLGQYEAEVASLRQQLEQLVSRQKQLEDDNSRLQVTPDQLKRSLLNLNLTEARYQELSKLDAEAMSVRDYAAVRLYEAVSPLESRCGQLETERAALAAELEAAHTQLSAARADLRDARQLAERAQQEQLTALQQLADAHHRLRDSALPRAVRDDLQTRLAQAESDRETALTRLGELAARADQAEEAEQQLKLATERLSSLEADQLAWARRLAEAAARQTEAEEEAARQRVRADQLAEAELAARRQYAALRDSARAQHQQQVAELRAQLMAEAATQCAELRVAQQQARDSEAAARQQARDTADRLESDLAAERGRLSDLIARLQIAEYELERYDVVAREASDTAKQLKDENKSINAQLHDKESTIQRQEASFDKERSRLEREQTDLKQRLAAYESFEKSWDDFISQAAKGGDGSADLLESGPPLPAAGRRRLQYSLQLGRRLVDSETAAARLSGQLRQQTELADRLQHQLCRLEPLLGSDGGTGDTDRWRRSEHTIEQLQTDKTNMSQRLRRLGGQLRQAAEQRDKLLTDIEVLLRQESELATFKLLVGQLAEPVTTTQRGPPQ